MSLYNMLFGVNPFAGIWMGILGLHIKDVGRFRDCYLNCVDKDIDEIRICLYTRNGGGNREEYQDVINMLTKHPCYINNYDDDFDCTYCTIEFKIPDKFKPMVEDIIKTHNECIMDSSIPPSIKWAQMFEKLKDQSMSNDPEVQRAIAIGQQIFNKIQKT